MRDMKFQNDENDTARMLFTLVIDDFIKSSKRNLVRYQEITVSSKQEINAMAFAHDILLLNKSDKTFTLKLMNKRIMKTNIDKTKTMIILKGRKTHELSINRIKLKKQNQQKLIEGAINERTEASDEINQNEGRNEKYVNI